VSHSQKGGSLGWALASDLLVEASWLSTIGKGVAVIWPPSIFGKSLTYIWKFCHMNWSQKGPDRAKTPGGQGTGDRFQPKPVPRGQGTADVNEMVQYCPLSCVGHEFEIPSCMIFFTQMPESNNKTSLLICDEKKTTLMAMAHG
jgi:hypothetical protein